MRNARGGVHPDPVAAAQVAEKAGADNITCHLREDRRHIKDADVWNLRRQLSLPLNLEIAATAEMLAIACEVKPAEVTLVPEGRQELTTEGGLQVFDAALHQTIATLREQKIAVALFIEPHLKAVAAASDAGATAVELHVGEICAALHKNSAAPQAVLEPACQAAEAAHAAGLAVHIGHGIDYHTAPHFKLLKLAHAANIGHAIIAAAVFSGLDAAVRRMQELLS